MALLRLVVAAVVVISVFVLSCDALVPELFHRCAGADDKMNYGEFVECMWMPFDDNKDGIISRDEFFSFLVVERHISPIKIPLMFSRTDLNHDNIISDADLKLVFEHMDTIEVNGLLSEEEFDRHRENALRPSRPRR